jgi:hypothetical protein
MRTLATTFEADRNFPACSAQSNLITIVTSTLPLGKMSMEEKLRVMELLWDDLCNKAAGMASPAWHEDVLAERDEMQQRGKDQFQDWEAAKKDIQSKV